MTAKTTINQQDLAGGFAEEQAKGPTKADNAAGALSDDEIANILERLQAIDFAKLSTIEASVHVRVMQALLKKIVARHDQFVALKLEAETRTRLADAAHDKAQLAAMLAKLDKELAPIPARKRWWRREWVAKATGR
jgi:hypothetical protein